MTWTHKVSTGWWENGTSRLDSTLGDHEPSICRKPPICQVQDVRGRVRRVVSVLLIQTYVHTQGLQETMLYVVCLGHTEGSVSVTRMRLRMVGGCGWGRWE